MTLAMSRAGLALRVSEVLGISDVNQRTLFHRGRVAVRAALEDYLNG